MESTDGTVVHWYTKIFLLYILTLQNKSKNNCRKIWFAL